MMAAPSSYWFEAIPDQERFPSLEGNLRVDAIVIGGGIAGVSAAYFLSQAGVSVALLEMGNLVTGDSGYTTAFATPFLDSVPASLAAWPASEAGIALLKEVAGRERIDCDWRDVDGIAFTRKEDTGDFRKDFETFAAVDPAMEYLQGAAASALVGFPVRAAFRKKGGEGQFHIRKFLISLAGAAAKAGAQFFERSEVTNIERGSEITLTTPKGSVSAKWLVVAAGPPNQFFPTVAGKLSGAITYVLHAAFSGVKPFGPSLFWDDLEPYHYFRWVNDSELILGGEDWVMKEKRPASNPHVALEAWLREVSGGAEFVVKNKWQGTIFYSPDVLPYMGPHPEYGEQVVFLTGWAGNGMAHGFLAGSIAADLVQRKQNAHQNIFSFTR